MSPGTCSSAEAAEEAQGTEDNAGGGGGNETDDDDEEYFSTKFDYKKMNFKLFRKKIISKIKKLEKKNIFNENIIVNVFFRTPFDIKKYMKCIIYKKNRDIYFIKPDIKISQLKKLIFNHGN